MKNIGILNFHTSNCNYGAVVQAVALQECLKKIGYDSEHIALEPPFSKFPFFQKFRNDLKREIKLVLGKELKVTGSHIFREFREKYLNTTLEKFKHENDLKKYTFNYKAIIVGSDQVWRPRYTSAKGLSYYLSFVDKPTVKIAYAASYGVDYWEIRNDEKQTGKIKKLLKEFDAISVREDSGVTICRDVFEVNATQVVDPTLLVGKEFITSIIGDHVDTRIIVYYMLNPPPEFIKLLQSIERCMRMKSNDIYYEKLNIRRKKYISVIDWLKNIATSRYILTDSFHCVCFALLFNKPFICFSNKVRGLTRIESLLKLLYIENRIVSEYDTKTIIRLLEQEIDYGKVNKRLDELRKQSSFFLIEALKTLPKDW